MASIAPVGRYFVCIHESPGRCYACKSHRATPSQMPHSNIISGTKAEATSFVERHDELGLLESSIDLVTVTVSGSPGHLTLIMYITYHHASG